MKYQIIILFLFFSFHENIVAQSSANLVKTLESAVKQRNPEILKPGLSPAFCVQIYELPDSYKMMENILKTYKALNKMEFLNETATGTGTDISIKCYFEDAKEFNSVISLDKERKITRVRYFDQLYGLHMEKESRLVAAIPFEFPDHKIIVKLKVNNSDRELKLMFDTGADGVGMKKETADAIGLVETRKQQTSVVGASSQIIISSGNTLRFDTLQIKNQNIGIFPSFDPGLDGLFGANFLRNYITYIDFDQSVIRLYSFGPIQYPEGGCILPLDYKSGLPGLKLNVRLNNGKELLGQFHFDTGAGYPLILFSPCVKNNDLDKGFKVQAYGTNYSFGHPSPTVQGIIDSLVLGKFTISHFSGTLQTYRAGDEQWARDGDGSLGIDIISKFNCYINLLDKEFYIIPNKSFHNPLDFWLGPVRFGVEKGSLMVKQLVPGATIEPEVRPNDVIVSINDKVADDFINSNTLLQLEKELLTGEVEMIVNRHDQEFKVGLPKK